MLTTPPELDQWFQGYEQLKDSQNNRKQKNSFLVLATSHNQCCRHPDSARSHHIMRRQVLKMGYEQRSKFWLSVPPGKPK